MVYKKFILIVLLIFFSSQSFCNILYNKKGIVITELEVKLYKDFYEKKNNLKLNKAKSLKDLVLIKSVINSLEKNNKSFLDKVDSIIKSQYGEEISNNQILNNFFRFTKLREEFIYEYFRNDLTITDIKNIFYNLDKLDLPISNNECLIINQKIDLKDNYEFIESFFINLKNNTKDFKTNIDNKSYTVCINDENFIKLERLIVDYINNQTKEDFENFVYGKIRN